MKVARDTVIMVISIILIISCGVAWNSFAPIPPGYTLERSNHGDWRWINERGVQGRTWWFRSDAVQRAWWSYKFETREWETAK